MPEILYQDDHYRVDFHPKAETETVVVGFQPRRRGQSKFKPRTYPHPFMPPSITESDIPAQFVSIVVNQYTWYLDDAAQRAAEAVRKRLPKARIVTYGSSMGAYAAINMSQALDADFTLALSPQSTPLAPFAEQINDKRYVDDRHRADPKYDLIGTGALLDRRGLVFFDPLHTLDAVHAARIAALTRMDLIAVPGANHPAGKMVNTVYSLRRLLTEVVTTPPDLATLRREIAEGVVKLQEAAALAEKGAPWLVEFLQGPGRDPASVDPVAFSGIVSRSLKEIAKIGETRAERLERIDALLAIALDPATRFASAAKRLLVFRNLCIALVKLHQRPRALEIAAVELPPEMAIKLQG